MSIVQISKEEHKKLGACVGNTISYLPGDIKPDFSLFFALRRIPIFGVAVRCFPGGLTRLYLFGAGGCGEMTKM